MIKFCKPNISSTSQLFDCRALFSNNYSHVTETKNFTKKKKQPYQILLSNTVDDLVKIPKTKILQQQRSFQISQLMERNHRIFMKDKKVLTAHIECLYSLFNRQLNPTAINFFMQSIIREANLISNQDYIICEELIKQGVIYKAVKMLKEVQIFSNEFFRNLMAIFFINLITITEKNKPRIQQQLIKINKEKIYMENGKIKNPDNTNVSQEEIKFWQKQTKNLLYKSFPCMKDLDILMAASFVLERGYHNEQFVILIMNMLNKNQNVQQNSNQHSQLLLKVILKLKIIYFLNGNIHSIKPIFRKDINSLTTIYENLLKKYFEMLRNDDIVIASLNSPLSIIQTELVFQFINEKQTRDAQQVYLDLFDRIFDYKKFGIIMCDNNKLKGIFQFILIFFNYNHAPRIHQILAQFQKMNQLYPVDKLDRLSTHCIVSQKFGFKSDVFAQKLINSVFYKYRRFQNEKNKRNASTLEQTVKMVTLAGQMMIIEKIVKSKQYFKADLKKIEQLIQIIYENYLAKGQKQQFVRTFFIENNNDYVYGINIKKNLKTFFKNYQQRNKVTSDAKKLGIRNWFPHNQFVIKQIQRIYSRYLINKNSFTTALATNHYGRQNILLKLQAFILSKKKHQEAHIFFKECTQLIRNEKFQYFDRIEYFKAYPQMVKNLLIIMGYNAGKQKDGKNIQQYRQKILDLTIKYNTAMKSTVIKSIVCPINQPYTNHILYNKLYIPNNLHKFDFRGIVETLNQDFLTVIKFTNFKIKTLCFNELDSHCKFFDSNGNVEMNRVSYPFICDLFIFYKGKRYYFFFRFGYQDHIMFEKIEEYIDDCVNYYIQKDQKNVIQFTTKEDFDFFVDTKIKNK